MTRKQRILERVRFIKGSIALGAPRTTALDELRQKYHISAERLRAICLNQPGCDYWN